MERDSIVQKLKSKILQAQRKGEVRKVAGYRQQLSERLEYLDRNGLANKPKNRG